MDLIDQTKKKKTSPKFDNFLEAFKDSQGSTPAKKADAFDFESFLSRQEERIRQQERLRFDQLRHEEQVIYSREQQQEKLEIQSLQIEIKKIAKEVPQLMVEAEKTAFQLVVAPGVYHKNFFRRLLSLLRVARKNITEGKHCLMLFNHRQQARSAYWIGVKKMGTSFMLSSDRTVATQAG